MSQERLQKFLSSAGVAARRKAEELITAGRVMVNGKVVKVLGTKIDPANDAVMVDGQAVVAQDHFYVIFNKPKACITAVSDDRGRPTVMDYLPNLPVAVRPVGRLDFYSEGVLLLTNDGELAAKLLAPASHVPKTYHVKIHGELSQDQLKLLRKGVRLDDGTMTMPAEVNVMPGESKHMWLGITLHEGKHRQIHRMIEALGFRVDKLQRVAFANLTFHGLRVGDARELTQQELNELLDLVGLPRGATARGRWRAQREKTDIPRRARQKARDEAEAAMDAAAVGAAGVDEDMSSDDEAWADESAPGAHRGSSSRGGEHGSAGAHRGPSSRGGERRGGGYGRESSSRGGERGSRGGYDRGPSARGGERGSSSRGGERGYGGGAPSGESRGGYGRGAGTGPEGSQDTRGGGFGGRDQRGPKRGAGQGRPGRSNRDGGGAGDRGARDQGGGRDRGPSKSRGFGSRKPKR